VSEVGPRDHDFACALRREAGDGTAIVELAFKTGDRQLQVMYGGSDLVLANSEFEPFGLVGLEAMAARSIVLAGCTGEDYILPYKNGFALDTDEPREIFHCLRWIEEKAGRGRAMRSAAAETAWRYRWTMSSSDSSSPSDSRRRDRRDSRLFTTVAADRLRADPEESATSEILRPAWTRSSPVHDGTPRVATCARAALLRTAASHSSYPTPRNPMRTMDTIERG
jgi:hypothetical protein